MKVSDSTPKISVIMSVFNNADTVSAAINSILNQTIRDFEFIIVDDASTDDSLKAVRLFATADKRIIVIQNLKNEGLAVSLNRALTQAKGEFIARQDAHATSRPDRLAAQARYLDEHPDIAILGTGTTSYIPPAGDAEIKRLLATKNIMAHGSIMARAKTLKAAGGYNPAYRYVQDYELWRRLIQSGIVFANLPEPLYEFTQKPKSPATNAERLLYLMNAKEGNKEILPLAKLPFKRWLEFYRYIARHSIKRFLKI